MDGLLTDKPISQFIQDVVKYLLSFISIIGVIYIIYAGFQLMIGAGDEEKMKKAKQIILYVVIGIVVMWLAYGIVNWTIKLITKTAQLDLFITETYAYSENQGDTFNTYKIKLQSGIEAMESELRVQGSVSQSSIQNVRNLVQEAYIRLPDTPEYSSKNESAKRAVDMYLDLASKNPGSQTHVGNAISNVSRFISEAKIGQITGNITASPNSWNAPLTVSFSATEVKDPSGVTPGDNNYIWWFRENGGARRELWRSPSLTQTFYKEGSYQVFLDVISGSRNSKGRTDVLPLSISQTIEVKPRLGEVVLLVNGVNASTLPKIKISPTIGKIGVLFDATASRAIGNGTIKKTKWDFGNDNTIEYEWSPVIERQLYVNKGTYKVTLEITTNQDQVFKKDIQLVVVDPSAIINSDKDVGYINESFGMSAISYFGNTANVEYTWQVTEEGSNAVKPIYTQAGNSLSYKFPKVGKYIVSLTSRSPNGDTDTDSKFITIESHEPVVNLSAPRSIQPERPNVIRFDASQSIDPDTNSAKDLSYTWTIDGNQVNLDNPEKGGAIGTYTFSEKWPHTVSLTVANLYGKIKTVEKTFDVTSTLSVWLNIVPRAAPLGTRVSFQAKAPKAAFYEWNTGDGSPTVNGTSDGIDHIYQKTGIYSVTLQVKSADGSESNTIERKVYVTDANSPFSLIQVSNSSNTITDEPGACGEGWAFLVNRSESTTLDGSNSINIDGNTSGISYTWKYLDRIKTGPSIAEKFNELGCFPVELTVRSERNGATHTSKRYIQIKNIAPKLTGISTRIDTSKKDSQKVIVTAIADGAKDEDGVITSYTWYYTTESDSEPQWVTITQNPQKTFVLPNINEKYYFNVILEDNDGARTNSTDVIRDTVPLIIANEDGNVNMPLISLKTPRSQVLAGETIEFFVQAKTILGTDITNKSEYAWDFDGDGKIDKKTAESRVTHIYQNTGNYNMKVKVTYNGTSNSKFQNITVKNELKARVQGYQKWDIISFMNVSDGIFTTADWQVGDIRSDALHSITIQKDQFSETGSNILTINSDANESSSVELKKEWIIDISSFSGLVQYQSYPIAENDTIHIQNRSQNILLGLFGNTNVTEYSIDTDTKIDSDLDGSTDNDIDNQDTASYSNGSAFLVELGEARARERTMKITLMKNGSILGTKIITVIFDFVANTAETINTVGDISGSGSSGFSTEEKENLDKLQEKIRTMSTDDRIILTQAYNLLIENWDDPFERTKKLIDIQEAVSSSSTLTTTTKDDISRLIDTILVWDAQSTDEVTVATKVIQSLIPVDSPNHAAIIEKVEAIKSHPDNLSLNKELGKSILEMVQTDDTIEEKYKLMIKNQLSIIVNGGQASIPPTEVASGEPSTSSGILAFISGTVKVFFIILAIIIFIVLLGFIIYRFSRKNDDIGFQDFLIDSIFHSKPKNPETPSVKQQAANVSTAVSVTSGITPTPSWNNTLETESTSSYQDPLSTLPRDYTPQVPETPPVSTASTNNSQPIPMGNEGSIPDWLKAPTASSYTENSIPEIKNPDPLSENFSEDMKVAPAPEVPGENTQEKLISTGEEGSTEASVSPTISDTTQQTPPSDDSNLPDWLKGTIGNTTNPTETFIDAERITNPLIEDPLGAVSTDMNSSHTAPEVPSTETTKETLGVSMNESTAGLPDWLVSSVQSSAIPESNSSGSEEKIEKKPRKKAGPKSETSIQWTPPPSSSNATPSDIPDWLK